MPCKKYSCPEVFFRKSHVKSKNWSLFSSNGDLVLKDRICGRSVSRFTNCFLQIKIWKVWQVSVFSPAGWLISKPPLTGVILGMSLRIQRLEVLSVPEEARPPSDCRVVCSFQPVLLSCWPCVQRHPPSDQTWPGSMLQQKKKKAKRHHHISPWAWGVDGDAQS